MAVKITDTILRDAHQSLCATRMRTEDMVPGLELLEACGYFSLEMWGGATFDVAMRFLNENPWDRIRTIKRHVKNTHLQMLLRGQNLVGYRHYADDVVYAFVDHAVEAGISLFRIFDAVNDIRNLQEAMRAVKKTDAICEGAISYTISPVHTDEDFIRFAQQLKDEGADIICIKDMAGLLSPAKATTLISGLKQRIGLPVHLHTHSASGMAPATIYAAAVAGVDIVDTALSPLSWGTAQPPTESIIGILEGTPWDTGLDLATVDKAAQYFAGVRKDYEVLINPKAEKVDTRILQHQIPGGMMSNLLSQLELQGASDKFDEVLLETARVRKDLGYPPLVTPTSQIVGTQAVFNVVLGERYKMVTNEVRGYILGKYGAAPGTIDPELAATVLAGEQPITVRPGSLMPPELQSHLDHVSTWPGDHGMEAALCYALFPDQATEFFAAQREGRLPATAEPHPRDMAPKGQAVELEVSPDARSLSLTLEGETSEVTVERQGGGLRVLLEGTLYEVSVGTASSKKKRRKKAGGSHENAVVAPLPGTLVRIDVVEGDEVVEGQVVAVLEAMKMQNELKAPCAGVVKAVHASKGENLDGGQLIVELEPTGE